HVATAGTAWMPRVFQQCVLTTASPTVRGRTAARNPPRKSGFPSVLPARAVGSPMVSGSIPAACASEKTVGPTLPATATVIRREQDRSRLAITATRTNTERQQRSVSVPIRRSVEPHHDSRGAALITVDAKIVADSTL